MRSRILRRSIKEKTNDKLDFYGAGFPYRDFGKLSGKLIVLEGTDGVGRSTQIKMVRRWLEEEGYAVADTGLTRSELTGPGLDAAKSGHTLGPTTMSLSMRLILLID